MSIDLK